MQVSRLTIWAAADHGIQLLPLLEASDLAVMQVSCVHNNTLLHTVASVTIVAELISFPGFDRNYTVITYNTQCKTSLRTVN